MDKRYELYCLADPVFFDSPHRVRGGEFPHTGRPALPGWRAADLEDWRLHFPLDAQLPDQGWKVHVSATLDNAERVLDVVLAYCSEHGVAVKFLRSRHLLLMRNAKYAHRGSSGKLLTLYPRDEAELERVLEELDPLLAGEPGPYVLSDLRWRRGPLYVRYGGFAERYCLSETGEPVLAIAAPDGTLVPDPRVPVFRVPDWVTLPDFLAEQKRVRDATTVAELPYGIERALHFSNGGGLYLGTELATGRAVVLKEARPHAGLARDGSDAVARLGREKAALERLAGLDVVPQLLDDLRVGEHRFLVLEHIEGQPLRAAMAQRTPLAAEHAEPEAAAGYTTWATEVVAQVEDAVAAVHARGLVIGDLHPFNILLRPDGRVVLVDFEVAAPVDDHAGVALADPDFLAPAGTTGFAVDDYALACLRLFLFLPLTGLLSHDPTKACDLAAATGQLFPVPAGFLEPSVRTLLGRRRTRPAERLDPTDWPGLRASIAEGILASATPERDDRLFPGDAQQFWTNGLNLAYGAAGVLLALRETGVGRFPEHEDWLAEHALQPPPGTRLGLYDGLYGVAYALDRLGRRDEALRLVELCLSELGDDWPALGSDLRSGLAGIGLVLDHFAEVTGDEGLVELALRLAELLHDRLGPADSVGTVSGGTAPYAGLLRGSSGPGLLFLRLHDRTGRPELLDSAEVALRQDLRRCVARPEDGALEVNEGWRTMPYLADGSVGIGLVLDEYLARRPRDDLDQAAARIRQAARGQLYVEPGLFHGRSGMILHLARGAGGPDRALLPQVRRLAWHALRYRGHLAFPGESLLRLSMDLATGSAGVLLALGAALHERPVGLPFLELAPPAGVRAEPALSTATGRR